MSTLMQGQAQAIEYLKSHYAFVEVDHQGNAVKVSWGHNCQVSDTGLEYLSQLTTVVELSLGQMTDARLAYLSKLVNLKRLSFQAPFPQASHITDEGLPYLRPLVNLEYLDLGSFAPITDQGLTHLVNLKKLQSLNLMTSRVTIAGLEQLKGLSELRYLEVPETLSLEYVQYFPKLEIVYGWDTNDEPIKYLLNLNNLQELYLATSTFETPSTPLVTDASVKTLIKLKTLKILVLWNTHITEQGLKELQNELPNCGIDVDIINEELGTRSELKMKAMKMIKSKNRRAQMSKRTIIQGEVTGTNEILSQGSRILCWTNAMQAAISTQPLDLSEYLGLVVEVSGILHGDLWVAWLEGVISEEGETEITGEVVGSNAIRGPDGDVYCYRHGMVEAMYLPLNLLEYSGKTITVAGMLQAHSLYRARIVEVPVIEPIGDSAKEAKSLKDLMVIRVANRAEIEAVNGNLGTALGFKWTNGQQTKHPCIIIFVPQKLNPDLVPSSEKAPKMLKADDGTWCLTDVVTGGKKQSLEDIDPLPPLSSANRVIVDELKSGRIGLIGGIQLAFYGGGIPAPQNSFVGTAGIAVRHRATRKAGFLTNQHVGDAWGRRMFHPWHNTVALGLTRGLKEFEADEDWYEGIIDESDSYVRCDCAFVEVLEQLQSQVRPGLHIIGDTGPLLGVDVNKMDIIGQRVISVGRTRGVQKGTIVAYAYEFRDDFYSVYTDFLILGQEDGAFSWKGDSGKVIVTDDAEHRPVALLWGGWQERLRHGREQEMWSYAIDLGKVLERLKLELLT